MSNFFKLYLIMFLFWGGGFCYRLRVWVIESIPFHHEYFSLFSNHEKKKIWIEFSQRDRKLNLGGVGLVIQHRRVFKKKRKKK